eukprot:gene44037-54725_t
MLAFALSFDEVIVTTFTAGQQSTLPIWMLEELIRPRQRPVTNVVAMIVVLVTFLPILGAYYLTIEPRTKPAKGVRVPLLSGLQEVLYAKADGALKVHDWVEVPNPDFERDTVYGNKEKKTLRATVGRVIFNQIWPKELGFINAPVPKAKRVDLILSTYNSAGHAMTVETLD